MTFNLQESNWSLSQALSHADTQRKIIAQFALSLSNCSLMSAGRLRGEESKKTSVQGKHLTTAAVVELVKEGGPKVAQVAGYYQQVALCETCPAVLTWSVLTALAVYPECLAKVASASSVTFAPWFEGNQTVLPFAKRFEQHIAGTNAVHAKTGLEIVLFEWQLYARFEN